MLVTICYLVISYMYPLSKVVTQMVDDKIQRVRAPGKHLVLSPAWGQPWWLNCHTSSFHFHPFQSCLTQPSNNKATV
jgi:hypothetical protein